MQISFSSVALVVLVVPVVRHHSIVSALVKSICGSPFLSILSISAALAVQVRDHLFSPVRRILYEVPTFYADRPIVCMSTMTHMEPSDSISIDLIGNLTILR